MISNYLYIFFFLYTVLHYDGACTYLQKEIFSFLEQYAVYISDEMTINWNQKIFHENFDS